MSGRKVFNIHDWRGQTVVNTGVGDIPRVGNYPRSKRERDFVLRFGLPDNEYGREVVVRGRSNFEAGFNALRLGLIPDGYVAHSLVEAPGRV